MTTESPLAPVDVDKVLDYMKDGAECLRIDGEWPQCADRLDEARAAVARMAAELKSARDGNAALLSACDCIAADLAAAREENAKTMRTLDLAMEEVHAMRQRAEAAAAENTRLRTELDKVTAQAINAMARLTTIALQEPRP